MEGVNNVEPKLFFLDLHRNLSQEEGFCHGDYVIKCLSEGTEEVIHRFCYVSTGRDVHPVDVYGRNVGGFGSLV